jgi:nucleoside 2-deoxyribosyltransferase
MTSQQRHQEEFAPLQKNVQRETALLTVSICGSYHRHLKDMKERIAECRQLGIKVLIPKYATRKSENEHGFVILRGENGSPKELQEKNFRSIAASRFLFVENPGGYIGPSTALEIGYAYARKIPIFCKDKPSEYIFTIFTAYGKTLPEIKSFLLEKKE